MTVDQPGISIAEFPDLEPFTTSLNQAFQPQGITAVSRYRGDCLQVTVVGLQVPDQVAVLRLLRRHLSSWQPALKVPALKVIVIGRQIGQITPVWTQTLELGPSRAETRQAKPQLAAEASMALPIPNYETQDFLIFLSSLGLLLGLGGNFWMFLHTQADSRAIAPTYQFNPLKLLPQTTPPVPMPVAPTGGWQTQVGLESAVTVPLPTQPGADPLITIKAVGDIIPGSNFLSNNLPAQPRKLFESVQLYLQGADILFGNFESTLTNYPNSAKDVSQEMVFAFRTPPTYAQVLQQVGFNVLSVANNHSYDFTAVGFRDTVNAIQQAGMQSVGQKNQILYSQTKGVTIAFIGFSYLNVHNQIQDLQAAKALVQAAQQRADIVVISMHAGAEGSDAVRVRNHTEMFYGEDRGNKVLFARTMIESGADLILGHGPHVARAMELYQGKLIVYSLGNFMGYQTLSTTGVLGESLVLEVQLNAQGKFVRGKILPIYLDSRGVPHPDAQGRSIQLIRELTRADFPETALKIDQKGQLFP